MISAKTSFKGTVDCVSCPAGLSAVYAPTLRQNPNVISGARQTILRFKPRQLIFASGSTSSLVYTLRKGWACRTVNLSDGRRQILSFLLPGDSLSLRSICDPTYRPNYSIRALTEVVLCVFRAKDLSDMMSASDEQRSWYSRHILAEGLYTERRLTDVGRRLTAGAIAQLVLELEGTLRARNLITGDTIDLPLRQEDIADALGVTPEHVNRTLVTLREAKVMELRQGRLHIYDRDQLLAIASS